jgi:alkanesulfonate monooxygenase SsuD/methylene tetrahydromethanopterin reductase-like flavin-dependent oxidoreductase (luciferase family)
MRQMKLYPKSVPTSLREAVVGIKRLAKGEMLTENGEYYSYDQVKLAHPAPDLKVLTAVVQAKSMELTAQIADGLILSVLAGPNYVRSVIAQLGPHWPAAGPPPGFQIVTYALACVDLDREAARRKVRGSTAFYLHAMGPTPMTGIYGINDKVEAMIKAGGAPALEKTCRTIGSIGSRSSATRRRRRKRSKNCSKPARRRWYFALRLRNGSPSKLPISAARCCRGSKACAAEIEQD